MIDRIKLGQQLAAAGQLVGSPQYWSEQKQDLRDICDDGRQIAEPCTEQTDQQSGRDCADAKQQQAGYEEKNGCARPNPEHNEDDDVDHHIVCDHNQISPDHSIDMNAQRCSYLPDDAFGQDENITRVNDRGGDEAPNNQSDGKEGEVIVNRLTEYFSIEET